MRGLRRSSSPAPDPASPTAPATPAESADLRAAVATLDPEDSPPGKLGARSRRPFSRTPRRAEAETPPTTGRTGRAGRAGRAGRRSRTGGSDATMAVNLLSPWVVEELGVRTLRFRFAYAALALVVALGLAWTGLHLQAGRAQTALEGEEAVGTALSTQIRSLAEVKAYVSGVDTRAQSVVDQMSGQVAFSRVLEGLEAALPPQTTLDSLAVTLPVPEAVATATGSAGSTTAAPTAPTTGAGATGDPAAGTCPGADPFAATDVVACVQITGSAATRDAVSTLVLRLDRDPLFSEPFVSATTASEDDGEGGAVSFTGSVGLTAEAANTRFADLVERLGSEKVAAGAKAARLDARRAERSAERAADPAGPSSEDQP